MSKKINKLLYWIVLLGAAVGVALICLDKYKNCSSSKDTPEDTSDDTSDDFENDFDETTEDDGHADSTKREYVTIPNEEDEKVKVDNESTENAKEEEEV